MLSNLIPTPAFLSHLKIRKYWKLMQIWWQKLRMLCLNLILCKRLQLNFRLIPRFKKTIKNQIPQNNPLHPQNPTQRLSWKHSKKFHLHYSDSKTRVCGKNTSLNLLKYQNNQTLKLYLRPRLLRKRIKPPRI